MSKAAPRVEVECASCGVAFTKRVTDAARSKTGRYFCTRDCRVSNGIGVKPKTGLTVSCGACGASVYRPRHRLDQGMHFCNKTCHDLWQSRLRVTQDCPTCGETYELKPSQKHYGSTYCSRACEARSRIRRPLDREHNGKPAVLDRQGYVRIYEPGHPRATRTGWIFEHRWIVEQALGRTLARDEHVHHINHVRSDNRPENLVAISQCEHAGITGRENGEALRAAIDARQKLAEYERRFGPLE